MSGNRSRSSSTACATDENLPLCGTPDSSLATRPDNAATWPNAPCRPNRVEKAYDADGNGNARDSVENLLSRCHSRGTLAGSPLRRANSLYDSRVASSTNGDHELAESEGFEPPIPL